MCGVTATKAAFDVHNGTDWVELGEVNSPFDLTAVRPRVGGEGVDMNEDAMSVDDLNGAI